MCSDVVVVTSIGSQGPAQMRLTKNDDMIQALAADRPDQPFGKAILPRRGWCGRLVPDAHGAQSACDDGTIDAIPIADEVFWGIIPRKRLGHLTRNPIRCRVGSDIDPDEVSAVEADDHEGVEQAKPMVGTTNKSIAAMSSAWLHRNVRHSWLGGPRRLTMYLATLDWATSNPSLRSSP